MTNKSIVLKSGLLIAISFFSLFTSEQLSATDIAGLYSNMVQDTEETGDCSGYTVRIVKDTSSQPAVYFIAHEGSCLIRGTKAERVEYLEKQDSLSFVVPFYSTVGRSYYRFQGRITKDCLVGQLNVEYPSEPKYNEVETIKLRRTTQEQLFPQR